MSPQASEDDSKHERNGRDESPKKQNSSLSSLSKKVYSPRNSVLTDLMSVNHLQTVHNISVSVFNLLFLNAIIFYITTPETLWRDLKVMLWASSKPLFAIKMWISFNLYAIAIFQGFKAWVKIRSKINKKLADVIFLFLYLCSIVAIFTLTPYAVIQHPFTPIINFAIMAEQVRIFMKVYSYVRESAPRVLMYDPLKDGDQEKVLYPSLKYFMFYLFAPALIYRESYPRKPTRDWRFVANMFFQLLACIFIAYCAFTRFVMDVFEGTGVRQFTPSEAALTLAGAMVVGSLMMFMVFYGILHAWLNACAEIARFTDREFYQDWWNSTSFSQYYRKWNIVVYDWLHAYVYIDSSKMGFTRTMSLLFVFFFSAFAHEYIIALSLGFFYPVLMVVYSTIGVIVLFLTMKRTANFWNTFMWTMIFCGWGVIVCLYASEWYARVNCPSTTESPWEFFIPRSWDKTCHIIAY